MNIYFIGIGGSGLAPLARLAKQSGHGVYGSDQNSSRYLDQLEVHGVKVYDQNGSYLDKILETAQIDAVVYSSGVGEDNGDLNRALELGITIHKRSWLINYILKESGQNLLAIAGTHGKSTTTSMMIWGMKELNIPCSYLVGSNLSWGESSRFSLGAEYFVYECDEFDKNILKFDPFYSIITSFDFDHPDSYVDENEYYETFGQFIDQTKNDIITIRSLEQKFCLKNSSYISSSFDQLPLSKVFPNLIGEHNRMNAVLCLKLLTLITDFEKVVIAKALNSFPGIERRQENLGTNLYTDYAHHPEEIKATIDAFREILN